MNALNPKCSVKELRMWLLALPSQFDDCGVESVVCGHPCSAKRVIAYALKSDPRCLGVMVNSMGTHLNEDMASEIDIISVLQ